MKTRKKQNWQKYTFEFLSIFIAVIAAFSLENWNDNRKSHFAEEKILHEIYDGIDKDLHDLRLNKYGHQQGIDAANYFRDLLASKTSKTDSLIIHYHNLVRDFISIQNTSGYETLKSRGLEIVENDSLRSKIVSLYEYDYSILRKIEEDYDESQFHKNYFNIINKAFSRNFIFNNDKLIIGFNQPIELTEDEEKNILVILMKIQGNRIFALNYYNEVEKHIEQLKNDIKKELE